jgi:hypothetical protein
MRNSWALAWKPLSIACAAIFATSPCYRGQNHGDFNMLFNAILNYNDLPER